MKRLEMRIAARYMKSRRSSRLVSLITFIATSGVMVGVMALVVVMGVMNGLQTELRDRILIASPHLRVLTYGTDIVMPDWRSALPVIRANPSVVSAAPFVLTQGLIVVPEQDYTEGVMVVGLDPDTGQASVTELPRHFTSGDLTFDYERTDVAGGVILGRRVAERMSAFPGDPLNFISAQGIRYNRAIGGYIPRVLPFEMTGEFETNMYEYDNNYVVLSLSAAQEFASLDTAVTGIEVRVRDPWQASQVGREIEETLGYPYRFVDWQTQNSNLFSALRLEKLAMAVILLLIILVAAFNIVSTLTMVVTDKTREIGILRAMGMSAKSIRRAFVLQGAIIGMVGTAIGASLGLVLAYLVDKHRLISIPAEVYFIDHLPVAVDPKDFILVIVASLAVATFATIFPANQAARFVPVEAIRHE